MPSRWVVRTRSSMRAPLRLIEPRRRGVSIRTRGVSPMTTRRSRVAAWVSAAGPARGWGTGTVLPLTTLVAGGLAVGSHRSLRKLQPISTIADRTIARIILRWSFTYSPSRYRIGAGAAPRVASQQTFGGQPGAPQRPIALERGDCIGRAARLIAAARRKHARRAQLPAPGDENEELRNHSELRVIPAEAGTSGRPAGLSCPGVPASAGM